MEAITFKFGEVVTVPGHIGTDVRTEVISNILDVKPDKILLVCDSGAYDHHPDYFAPLLQETCSAAGETCSVGANGRPQVEKYMLPGGDECKSWEHLSALMGWAFQVGATKRSVVVAFGGGAVLNVVGLFASMLYRGVNLIYVPTTFLAMHNVVTSIKTSINTNGVKNKVGSYYAPTKILIDTGFCRTLPRQELFSGLGVLAKNALLLGEEHIDGFIAALSQEQYNCTQGSFGEEFAMDDHMVMTLTKLGIDAKMQKLRHDAHETNVGIIFEYGLMVSRAIRGAYGDRVVPHGLGVVYGMLQGSYAAERMCLMSAEDRHKHDALCWLLLKRYPLPEPRPSIECIMGFVMKDERRGLASEAADEVSSVLLHRIGEPVSTVYHKHVAKFPSSYVSKWLYTIGFVHEAPLESPRSLSRVAAVVTPEECKSLLDAICKRSDEDLAADGFGELTVGFANHVWRKPVRGHSVLLKRYTQAAFVRLDAEAIGCVDVLCGSYGIGPPVFYSSSQGLAEQFLAGRTLEEADIHRGDFALLDKVAAIVTRLHRLEIPAVCQGEAMLWRTMNNMLHVAAFRPELWPQWMPSLDTVCAEVNRARMTLELREYPIVLCHGDLKPSNVFLNENPARILGGHLTVDIWQRIIDFRGDSVNLIDFELGGPNYRAYDLMKLFRTAESFSDASLRHFIRAYADRMGHHDYGAIVEEAKLFEPLTWLEAACFFLALPHFKPAETPRWNALALDRWERYEATKSRLVGEDAWRTCMAWLG